MRLLVLYPSHLRPDAIAGYAQAVLGDGWTATGVAEADADPLALAEAEIVLGALAPLGATDIERAERLRFVQASSHGFDHIDTEAAAARGIPVANVGTTGAEAANVAEHVFALALASAKRLVDGHLALREARWANQDLLRQGLWELHGKTLGIVGMGQIGREVAKRAHAFDMTILYHDVVAAPDVEGTWEARRVELPELLSASAVVTVHVPLTAATRGLIGRAELARMRDGTIVVNTARGPVVDADALAAELQTGRLLAGIDVFEPEPPGVGHPLLDAPNVVLSPHTAGVTRESVRRIMTEAIENVRRFASGEPPRDVVNGVGSGR